MTTALEPPTTPSELVHVPANSQSSNLTFFALSILTISLLLKSSVCGVFDSNDIPLTTIF